MASTALISTPSVIEYTKNAAAVVEAIAPVAGGTLLKTAAKISQEIIAIVEGLQTTKTNKEKSIRIAGDIHHILVALTNIVFVTSDSILDVKMLDQIGVFVGTLQKLYGSLRRQQELGKFKRILRQGQIAAQLEAYELELSNALNTFKMQLSTDNTVTMVEIRAEIEVRHQQLLELIATQTDKASTISSGGSLFSGSSSSTSLWLPPQPQIFFGRERELEHVVKALAFENARLAILGAVGMGKTTLATVALHNPSIMERYKHRYFVPCESSNTASDLIALVGFQLGFEPSRQLTQDIINYFEHCGPALIVFDNLDTPWEGAIFRPKVEEFLSMLADVKDLAIIVTMRGSERPAKVKWTRPFLPVLEPLSAEASRDIFLEIADDPKLGEEAAFSQILEVADNLPLAIHLLAYLVAGEGYTTVLARWKVENVSIISIGFDKGSSLDQSIMLSLTSPRMQNTPEALQLLALLSLLPDGIQHNDLIKARVPISGLAECTTVLLRTSLAHITPNKRLKALTPIREFMRNQHPAPLTWIQPLQKYFQDQLFLWKKYHDNVVRGTLTPHLNTNTGNIYSLLSNWLQHRQQPELGNVGQTILVFDDFSAHMLKGNTPLMEHVPKLISTGDRYLYWEYFSWLVRNHKDMPSGKDVDGLLDEAIEYYEGQNDHVKQVWFYTSVTEYHRRRGNFNQALKLSELSISLASARGLIETRENLHALWFRALIERDQGNYHRSLYYGQNMSQLSSKLGLIESEAEGLSVMGSANFRLGNIPAALDQCERSQKLIELVEDNSQFTLRTLSLKAVILFEKTEYQDALRCSECILRMTGPHRMPFFHADALLDIANINIIIGRDTDKILSHVATAQMLCTQLGWKSVLILCEVLKAKFNLMAGNKTNAATALIGLLRAARGHAARMFGLLEVLGDPTRELFTPQDTFPWTVTYLAQALKAKYLGHIYQSLRCLGDVLLAQGDEETALSIFRVVLAGSTEMDVHRRRADCMIRIGDILEERGETTEAKEMWKKARPLFVVSSQVKDVTAIDRRLGRKGAKIEPVPAEEKSAEVSKAGALMSPMDGLGEIASEQLANSVPS